MSIQDFGTIDANASLKQVVDALADLQDTLNFLLNGNLDVKNLRADSVNADRIKAHTITADRMDVTELSAISANLGHITAGLIEAVQIFGSYIATSTGYPRTEMSTTGNQFGAYYNASSGITLNPNYLGATPVINFHYGTIDGYIGYFNSLSRFVFTSPDGADIEISNGGTSGDISLRPVNNLNVPDWSEIINDTTFQSLQAALNAKANVFSGYTGSFSTGTQTVNVNSGIITSVV